MKPAPTKLDPEEILAALDGQRVLDALGLRSRRSGRGRRMPECPRCGGRSKSWGIVLYQKDGRWRWMHHGRAECCGDMLDLIAVCNGLDRTRDFPELLERGAAIAGVSARPLTETEIEERRAYRRAREADERATDEAAHRKRRHDAKATWPRLDWKSANGEHYLRARGLDPQQLAARGFVRFDRNGNICVPLYDFAGELATVTRRLLDPRSTQKILVPTGGTQCGTLLNRYQHASLGGDVFIAEGIFDALTATQLWPKGTVIGAGGAGQLRSVAWHVAPLVRRARGRLWIIPDRDDVGQKHAAIAIRVARSFGLAPHVDLRVVDVAPYHDLNEAHCAGWKP